ncbi:hypothetical protein JVT61DRAFT_14286 [Boletus reticuloceps]|uniref:Uncharacterized protein n=1 Tax=Boletus reticuloceps TaxID=495285 RepID=A0A8I2YCU2_9AGAM|nr:hypothetical protein JVT61DRAFT_14286 [Boletus reticuloceps]
MVNEKLAAKRREFITSKNAGQYAIQHTRRASSIHNALADRVSREIKVHATRRANDHDNNVLTKRRSSDSEQQLQAKLREIIGQSLRQCMEALCKEYMSTGEYRKIYDTLTAVEKLSEETRKLSSGLGYTKDYLPIESPLSRTMCTVSKVLEDLLLNAMEGEEMGEKEQKGLLLYQAAPDIILQ